MSCSKFTDDARSWPYSTSVIHCNLNVKKTTAKHPDVNMSWQLDIQHRIIVKHPSLAYHFVSICKAFVECRKLWAKEPRSTQVQSTADQPLCNHHSLKVTESYKTPSYIK